MEQPLEIDQEYVDHPEYVQALYELRDRYLADRAADRASGTQRPRRGGGRRRGTTVTRARTMTESSSVSTVPPTLTSISCSTTNTSAGVTTQQPSKTLSLE